eukprot:gene8542-10503_t
MGKANQNNKNTTTTNNNKRVPSKQVFQSGDKKEIITDLNKLNEWITNSSDFKEIEKLGIFPSILALLHNEDKEIVKQIVKFLKGLTAKESSTNEILRSLDAIHKLESLLETSTDPDILNDSSTAIEFLRKCAPYSIRKVGLGNYNEENGEFQWLLEFKQLHFDEVGVASKVWDGGIGLSKWILENKQIFSGKEVLELGSGLGITGCAAGLICKSVLMTDYTTKIIQTLKENLKLNANRIPELKKSCTVQQLDWVNDKVPKPFHYDIVIGSEVIYDEKLMEALSNVIYQSLSPNGVFYSTCATVRRGIPDFVKCMESKGFTVEQSEFPKHYVPDTKFDIWFFKCSKKKQL